VSTLWGAGSSLVCKARRHAWTQHQAFLPPHSLAVCAGADLTTHSGRRAFVELADGHMCMHALGFGARTSNGDTASAASPPVAWQDDLVRGSSTEQRARFAQAREAVPATRVLEGLQASAGCASLARSAGPPTGPLVLPAGEARLAAGGKARGKDQGGGQTRSDWCAGSIVEAAHAYPVTRPHYSAVIVWTSIPRLYE